MARALHNVEQSADVEQVIHILHTAVHGALHRRFEHLNEARLNLLVAALIVLSHHIPNLFTVVVASLQNMRCLVLDVQAPTIRHGYVKYARIGRISNVSALYLACIC